MACSNVAMIRRISEQKDEFPSNQCLLHSFLEGDNVIGDNSVVEYSYLGKGAKVGKTSIVSNVFVAAGVTLPDNAFLHTVCVKSGAATEKRYVTVAFGIKDNLKKTCLNTQSMAELRLHGKNLDEALNLLGYPKVLFLFF